MLLPGLPNGGKGGVSIQHRGKGGDGRKKKVSSSRKSTRKLARIGEQIQKDVFTLQEGEVRKKTGESLHLGGVG